MKHEIQWSPKKSGTSELSDHPQAALKEERNAAAEHLILRGLPAMISGFWGHRWRVSTGVFPSVSDRIARNQYNSQLPLYVAGRLTSFQNDANTFYRFFFLPPTYSNLSQRMAKVARDSAWNLPRLWQGLDRQSCGVRGLWGQTATNDGGKLRHSLGL